MKQKQTIIAKAAPPALGPYSHAIVVDGFVFVSGQIGLDKSGKLVEENIEAQAKQTFKNIDAILTASGCVAADIVKVTIFLVNSEDFPKVNELYKDWVSAPYPSRSTITAASLPLGALIEIECIAKLKSSK